LKLTILFEGQFWVGVVEERYDEGLKVARYVFGSEPIATEVFAFVLRGLPALLRATPLLESGMPTLASAPVNPKRRQREAAAEARGRGASTYAQEALRQQLEAHKQERRTQTREEREARQEYERALKRQQAKARHRGR
jgi:DUF2992 family protein